MNIAGAYTGVGSRKTPKKILQLMESTAISLAKDGFILRSGAAKGADSAFEKGAIAASGQTEIYLPWIRFNNHPSRLYDIPDTAMQIAKRLHPAWQRLTNPARKLQARNSLQLLGKNSDPAEKSLFLLCYTESGKIQGGTGQAIRLAVYYEVPVFNFGNCEFLPEDVISSRLKAFLYPFQSTASAKSA
jgi:hypothetical protein